MNENDNAALLARIERLEGENAVRRVLAEYMWLGDRLDADTPMERFGELFCRDAVWEGVGERYAAAFGRHEGRAAILALFNSLRNPPLFAFNGHYLTSESITVDGLAAEGRWMALQAFTQANGTSGLNSAALRVKFAFEEGRWRIALYQTESLFGRATRRWDDPAPTEE